MATERVTYDCEETDHEPENQPTRQEREALQGSAEAPSNEWTPADPEQCLRRARHGLAPEPGCEPGLIDPELNSRLKSALRDPSADRSQHFNLLYDHFPVGQTDLESARDPATQFNRTAVSMVRAMPGASAAELAAVNENTAHMAMANAHAAHSFGHDPANDLKMTANSLFGPQAENSVYGRPRADLNHIEESIFLTDAMNYLQEQAAKVLYQGVTAQGDRWPENTHSDLTRIIGQARQLNGWYYHLQDQDPSADHHANYLNGHPLSYPELLTNELHDCGSDSLKASSMIRLHVESVCDQAFANDSLQEFLTDLDQILVVNLLKDQLTACSETFAADQAADPTLDFLNNPDSVFQRQLAELQSKTAALQQFFTEAPEGFVTLEGLAQIQLESDPVQNLNHAVEQLRAGPDPIDHIVADTLAEFSHSIAWQLGRQGSFKHPEWEDRMRRDTTRKIAQANRLLQPRQD